MAAGESRLSTRIDKELHRQLKILVASKETTIAKVVEEALTDYIRKRNEEGSE